MTSWILLEAKNTPRRTKKKHEGVDLYKKKLEPHNCLYNNLMQYKPCTNWNSLQGVEVLIDVETYEYFSVHSSGSEGVLVLIQHYRDIPLMRKESFVLAPGTEADVGLSITEIITTQVRTIWLVGSAQTAFVR